MPLLFLPVSVLGFVSGLLGVVACGATSGDGSGSCTSAAECVAGAMCSAGQCVSPPTTSGAGGAPAASSGATGMNSSNASSSAGGGSSAGATGGGSGTGGSGAATTGSGGTGSSGGGPAGAGGMSAGGMGGTGSGGAAQVGNCDTEWEGYPSYNGNGSVTFYTFAMGSNCEGTPTGKCVNCNFEVTGVGPDAVAHVHTGDGRHFGAMNTQDFNDAAACGTCAEVTRDGNRSVVVTIVDRCPDGACQPGHIDLSREAFLELGSEAEGRLGVGGVGTISWRYVPCPVPNDASVSLRLKEPNNEYYTAVIVEDHEFPIASVQIKGVEAQRDGASNFWLVGDGNQFPPPWHVRATDVNGWVYESTLSLGQSGAVSTGQMAACD